MKEAEICATGGGSAYPSEPHELKLAFLLPIRECIEAAEEALLTFSRIVFCLSVRTRLAKWKCDAIPSQVSPNPLLKTSRPWFLAYHGHLRRWMIKPTGLSTKFARYPMKSPDLNKSAM